MIRRLGWPVAALAAFAFLVALALHGKRPEAGLVGFQAAGYLKQFAPQDAVEVAIATPGGTKRFTRDAAWPARLDEALRLLRDSGPMRVMSAEEVAGQPLSAYGLDDKATAVAVRSRAGDVFAIRFGARNPLGSGRYVQVKGVPGVPILPSYVGDAWEHVTEPAAQ